MRLTNEIVVCEERAGKSDRDLPSLLAFFEPVEFIQPGPEAAMSLELARPGAGGGAID